MLGKLTNSDSSLTRPEAIRRLIEYALTRKGKMPRAEDK